MHFLSDFLAVVSVGGAVTAWQQQVAWLLQCGAAVVAIVAGCVAIYYRIWRPLARRDE